MRRAFLFGAAVLVLGANGWGVWQAARNRDEPYGGTLQLTEREVPLRSTSVESSVTVLRLNWRTDGIEPGRWRSPAWLNANKIKELGFDCSVPLSSPKARRHYSSKAPRRVFLALTFRPVDPEQVGDKRPAGLVVVDAALNPQQLRERYPDPQKHVICRGLVRLAMLTHDRDGTLLSAPRLEAWIENPLPSQLSVPKPANRLLLTLHRTVSEERNTPITEPRFTARVHWGTHYEPWVDEVNPLNQ